MRVELLDQASASEFWDVLQPYVEAALSFDPYATITPQEVQQQVAEGYARVWIAHHEGQLHMATVGQIWQRTDGDRVLHVLATAGDESHKWLPELLEQLQELARQESCVSVTMAGRPGWARKLRKFGWQVASIDMEWKLDEHGEEQTEEQQSGLELHRAVASPVPAEPAGAGPQSSNGQRSTG